MLVKDVMSKDLACCTPQQSCVDAAKLMKSKDVGAIPIVADQSSKKLVGMITDRDICIRVVAAELNPKDTKIETIMSRDLVTAKPDDDLEACARLMREKQVRRIAVVDRNGVLVGVVGQADIAQETRPEVVKETVKGVSKPGKGLGREAA